MSQTLEQDIVCPECGETFTLDYQAEDTEADCPECECVIVLTIDPATSKITKVEAAEGDDEDEDEDDDETEIEAVDDDDEEDEEDEE